MASGYFEPNASKRRRSRSSRRQADGGAWQRFMMELRDLGPRYWKRTSTGHKRLVVLLILAGVLLRGWMLFQPLSADEATGFVRFATRSVPVVVSDMSHYSNHVLNTLLVKLVTSLVGVSNWSVRLPAFLAGILLMPLYYLFVRSMFNRYIALMALAMVAASGGLIEYSALSRGFALAWLFMIGALMSGRYFIKEGGPVAALALAICAALGVWSVPTALYGMLMVYGWVLLSLLADREHARPDRMLWWSFSVLAALALALLLYAPVVSSHGIDQLFHQGDHTERSWARFKLTHADAALDLWVYLSETSALWLTIPGLVGLLYAAFISSKFRRLAFALLITSVPVVMVLADVGQPRKWLFTLFILHLSSAISLFYLLKFVQDKLYPAFEKRRRTAAACLALLVSFAWLGMPVIQDRVPRHRDLNALIDRVLPDLSPADRIYGDPEAGALVSFKLVAHGYDPGVVTGPPGAGGTAYVVVDERQEWTVDQVLRFHLLDPGALTTPERVGERNGSMIFAARFR